MLDNNGGRVLIYSRVQGIWSLNYNTIPNPSGSYNFIGSSLAFSKDGVLYVGANGYGKRCTDIRNQHYTRHAIWSHDYRIDIL